MPKHPKTLVRTEISKSVKDLELVDCLTLQVTSIEAPESELSDSSHRKVPICNTMSSKHAVKLESFPGLPSSNANTTERPSRET